MAEEKKKRFTKRSLPAPVRTAVEDVAGPFEIEARAPGDEEDALG